MFKGDGVDTAAGWSVFELVKIFEIENEDEEDDVVEDEEEDDDEEDRDDEAEDKTDEVGVNVGRFIATE